MWYHGISHESLVFSLGIYTSLDIPRYTKRERCIENTVANTTKVGRHTVEYITAFLYSDWLYFLWHGINNVFRNVLKCLRCSPLDTAIYEATKPV